MLYLGGTTQRWTERASSYEPNDIFAARASHRLPARASSRNRRVATPRRTRRAQPRQAGSRVAPVGGDPVAEYVRLAAIPREHISDVEEFLYRQQVGSDTVAVLERPGQPVALLRIHAG